TLCPGGPLAGPWTRSRLDQIDGRHDVVLVLALISVDPRGCLKGCKNPVLCRSRGAYSGAGREKQGRRVGDVMASEPARIDARSGRSRGLGRRICCDQPRFQRRDPGLERLVLLTGETGHV